MSLTSDVIRFPVPLRPNLDELAPKLDCVLSIFHAIDSGELLAALPDCPVARAQHLAALNLLRLAEQELNSILDVVTQRTGG